MLAGCTDAETPEVRPNEISRGPKPPPPPLEVSLPKGADQVAERSGRGRGSASISGKHGPNYRYVVRCDGGGELVVRGPEDPDPLRVACDGVQNGQQVVSDEPQVDLEIVAKTDGRWKLVMIKPTSN
jgi:hypothetical protein